LHFGQIRGFGSLAPATKEFRALMMSIEGTAPEAYKFLAERRAIVGPKLT